MILDKDIRFLKWLAQRLVNKYSEDPKIVLIINELTIKLENQSVAIKQLKHNINESVATCVKSLQKIIIENSSIDHKTREKTKSDFF